MAFTVLVVVGLPLAVWMYAFAHALFADGRPGLALLIFLMPVVAFVYTIGHRHTTVPPRLRA